MSEGPSVLLDELPEQPTGWTKRMTMHLNFGGGKGSGTYSIHDAEGCRVEGIMFAYNTSKGGGRGFMLEGGDDQGYLSWPQLREAYAAARRGLTGEQKP